MFETDVNMKYEGNKQQISEFCPFVTYKKSRMPTVPPKMTTNKLLRIRPPI